ncbi:hypothetical protein C8R44DRAFT_745984 [Mycena epipterygia]|nr:hypothetical protein C8R44DRAFT_745984 [Mycena epipterygia]
MHTATRLVVKRDEEGLRVGPRADKGVGNTDGRCDQMRVRAMKSNSYLISGSCVFDQRRYAASVVGYKAQDRAREDRGVLVELAAYKMPTREIDPGIEIINNYGKIWKSEAPKRDCYGTSWCEENGGLERRQGGDKDQRNCAAYVGAEGGIHEKKEIFNAGPLTLINAASLAPRPGLSASRGWWKRNVTEATRRRSLRPRSPLFDSYSTALPTYRPPRICAAHAALDTVLAPAPCAVSSRARRPSSASLNPRRAPNLGRTRHTPDFARHAHTQDRATEPTDTRPRFSVPALRFVPSHVISFHAPHPGPGSSPARLVLQPQHAHPSAACASLQTKQKDAANPHSHEYQGRPHLLSPWHLSTPRTLFRRRVHDQSPVEPVLRKAHANARKSARARHYRVAGPTRTGSQNAAPPNIRRRPKIARRKPSPPQAYSARIRLWSNRSMQMDGRLAQCRDLDHRAPPTFSRIVIAQGCLLVRDGGAAIQTKLLLRAACCSQLDSPCSFSSWGAACRTNGSLGRGTAAVPPEITMPNCISANAKHRYFNTSRTHALAIAHGISSLFNGKGLRKGDAVNQADAFVLYAATFHSRNPGHRWNRGALRMRLLLQAAATQARTPSIHPKRARPVLAELAIKYCWMHLETVASEIHHF